VKKQWRKWRIEKLKTGEKSNEGERKIKEANANEETISERKL
jgi:hypothetical protein